MNEWLIELLIDDFAPFSQSATSHHIAKRQHRLQNTTKSRAVARIADRTDCQWPSRSSKINVFHFVRRSASHFLLVINSNLGRISSPFPRYCQFSVEKRTFFTSLCIELPIWKCFPWLNGWNFACPSAAHVVNYLCIKFLPYDLKLSHNTLVTDRQTDRQTNGQLTTRTNSLTVT